MEASRGKQATPPKGSWQVSQTLNSTIISEIQQHKLRDQLEQEVKNLRTNFANLEALQHNTKVLPVLNHFLLCYEVALIFFMWNLTERLDGGSHRGWETEGGVEQSQSRELKQSIWWERQTSWKSCILLLLCCSGDGQRGTQEMILSLKKSLEAEQLKSMTLAQVRHSFWCNHPNMSSSFPKPGAWNEEIVNSWFSTTTWIFLLKVSSQCSNLGCISYMVTS